eukprot:TRINITY_DN2427_c1_g1_i3.p1 TRINITY_DN2427_c1_g1~~TRINITY_DN2427_c1_g1_i3.p1  ORF type:complete len:948 (+),score=188.20 TRINITY_DN2427_c1_g1_i3:61-2904(+)
MGLSLKSVAIVSMVTCILTTVITTVVIAVVTTDNALNTTKKQQDESIDNCFNSGETNLVEMTNHMLTEKSEKIKAVIDGLLNTVRKAHQTVATSVQSIEPAEVNNLASYAHMDHLFAAIWHQFDLSVMAHVTIEPGIGYLVGDNSKARDLNAKLGYKHINSTTLIRAQGPPSAGTAGTLRPLRGGFYDIPCNYAEILTEFTGPGSGECSSPLDPMEVGPVQFSLSLPVNTPTWSGSIGFASYTGVLLSMGYDLLPNGISTNGKAVGVVVAGFDLAGVNSFLRSQVAGDHERIFTVDGNVGELGTTAGVSHGIAVEKIETPDPLFPSRGLSNVSHPIHCTAVTDEVIRKSCNWLYSQVGSTVDPFVTASNRQRRSNSADVITITMNGTETEYFLLTNKLEDDFNLNWWINVLVLKDYVVGPTRQRKLEAEHIIEENNKSVDEDLTVGRAVLYCVIFGIAAMLILMSIVGTAYITKPLEVLSIDMGIVGELRLEDVNEMATPSMLSEVRSMQASFKLMLEAMKEYRQYMPQAVVDRTDNTSDESASDTITIGGKGSISSRGTRTPIESGLGSATYKKPPNRWDVASSSSRTATSVYSKRTNNPQAATLSLRLSRRKCAAHCTVGLRDWERFAHGNRDTQLIVDVHSSFLHCAIQDVKTERGLVERFVGDSVDVSFGGLLTCPAPSAKAVKYSLRVRERMQSFEKDHRGFGDDLTLVVGIASGSTLAGNLGCQGMKSPATLGRLITVSRDLQQIAKEIGLDIILCSRTDDDIRGTFASVPVDILKNTLGKKVQASYLVGRDAAADRAGEWMYTMIESRSESIYDKAWSLVKQGQLVPGLDALYALRSEDIPRMVANRLTQYIDDTVSLTGKTPTEYFRMIRSHSQPGPVAELLYHAYQPHPTAHRAGTSTGVISPPELISPKLEEAAVSRFDIQLSAMPSASGLRSPPID